MTKEEAKNYIASCLNDMENDLPEGEAGLPLMALKDESNPLTKGGRFRVVFNDPRYETIEVEYNG